MSYMYTQMGTPIPKWNTPYTKWVHIPKWVHLYTQMGAPYTEWVHQTINLK
jgi:hypothetical protein